MSGRLPVRIVVAVAAAGVTAAGCAATGSSGGAARLSTSASTRSEHPAGAATGSAATRIRTRPWTTYGRNNSRAGTISDLGAKLRHAWTRGLDGAVYGVPVVAHGRLIVATENDSVYALSPRGGRVLWRRHLGTPQPQSALPCGDIDPLGITGAPAYDSRTGSVFVATETNGGHHTLWALNAKTGRRRWHRTLDVERSRNRYAEQERSALLVTDGRVLTSFGGLAGDCSNYVGYTTSVPTSGKGRTHAYAVPTSREAGMWAPAGPVVGPHHKVYVASGNGAELGGKWDKSDSVTELAPRSMKRLGVFAPASWAQDNQQDLDLGSSAPVPVAGRIVIAGKRGTVYLLRPSLGGVGASIATRTGCAAYGGAAHAGHTVVLPCDSGVRALHVGKHGMHWRWSGTPYGSPLIGGAHVYVPDRNSGRLFVLSSKTGQTDASYDVGDLTHFPALTAYGRRLLVPTLHGLVAFAAK